jgi:hypothetical protein
MKTVVMVVMAMIMKGANVRMSLQLRLRPLLQRLHSPIE